MKILFVCKGNPELYKTWSGVPRILLNRLRDEGNDVSPFNLFDDFWFHSIGAIWNFMCDFRKMEFESTIIGGWLMARAVRKAAKGFDKVVALTFALDSRTIPVPVELVHDWTLGYFWKRWDAVEARQIKRMRRASKICCIYPASAAYLRSMGLKVDYIGLPVEIPDYVKKEAIGKNASTNGCRYVVFAPPKHRDNLDSALKYLAGQDFHLDVIGSFGVSSQNVTYHGYLDKDIQKHAARYWRLLLDADYILALGETWPGGSSIAEAKACGCKVIANDWPDLRA